MGFLDKLFGRKKEQVNLKEENSVGGKLEVQQNTQIIRLQELKQFLDFLINADKYIAKSEYVGKIGEYKDIIDFFNILKSSGMLENFCALNNISLIEVQYVLTAVQNIEKIVERHNEDYIAQTMICEKQYLDNVLKDVDPEILLDEAKTGCAHR